MSERKPKPCNVKLICSNGAPDPRGVAVLATLCAASLIGGLAIGYAVNAGVTPGRTTLNVTVSANFGITIMNGTTVVAAFNSSYNCSALAMFSMKAGMSDYNTILDYLRAHPSEHVNGTDITDIFDGFHGVALTEELVSEGFFDLGGGSITENSSFDGLSYTFDFGNYVVMIPSIAIFTYINGSDETFGFTFESIIDFVELMGDPNGANLLDFENAGFLIGANTLRINELVYDIEDEDLSSISVVFNGVAMDLVTGGIF